MSISLATSESSISSETFWKVVELYHNRPHLINRNIVANTSILLANLTSKIHRLNNIKEILENHLRKHVQQFTKDSVNKAIRNVFEAEKIEFKESNLPISNSLLTGIIISIRLLLPKSQKSSLTLEVCWLDKSNNVAGFLTVPEEPSSYPCAPPFTYNIELYLNKLRIIVSNEDARTIHATWLKDKLFNKLNKWSQQSLDGSITQSLALIEVDEYFNTYNRLKVKYSQELLNKWSSKATTDPLKYVFEDIAIASYLICLWTKLQEENVNFVDCGCGNGLLVYLLNGEGFEGCGVDIRRRAIWDIYPNVTLKELLVEPSSVFCDATWLIGNHSDELTPWLPIIAQRSSSKTNYFVLPCCPFDLNGQKFIRKNTSLSQYADYLNHIESLSNLCGFTTIKDKLRIPSTKRNCLIGLRQNYNKEFNLHVESYLNIYGTNNKIRDKVESVRNCTQIDKQLIKKIIQICINNILLNQEVLLQKTDGQESWNKGGMLVMSELCKIIPSEDLKQLKNECGGLQTLLRNHRYIFCLNKQEVILRMPVKLSETDKYKEKPCWMITYHPNGCLYGAKTCGYKH